MTTTVSSGTTTRRLTSTPSRVGLILAAVLAIGDIVAYATQAILTYGEPISIFMLVAGVVTLVAIPFGWRGSTAALWVVAVFRVLSSLTGLPAFFFPGVPAPFVITAAVGILLAVLVAVLLFIRRRPS